MLRQARFTCCPQNRTREPPWRTFRGAITSRQAFSDTDGDANSHCPTLASRSGRCGRTRQRFQRAIRPLRSTPDKGDGAPEAYRRDEASLKVSVPASEPGFAPFKGGLSSPREFPAWAYAKREGTSSNPEPRTDLACRRRRSLGKGNRVHSPDCGTSRASSEHLWRRQPEKLNGPPRHLYAAHRQSSRSF